MCAMVGGFDVPATGDGHGRREQIVRCRRHGQQADRTGYLGLEGRQREVEVNPPGTMYDVCDRLTDLAVRKSDSPQILNESYAYFVDDVLR